MQTNLNYVRDRFLHYLSPSVKSGNKELSMNDFDEDSLQTLGQGATATVYVATKKLDPQPKPFYALKRINKARIQRLVGYNFKTQIEKELDIMYSMEHENVLKLYDHFEDDEFITLVLEHAERGDLHTLLLKTNQCRLDERTTIKFIKQIVAAFEYLQSKDILHRDIKPENILLGKNYEIKVADFGSAKAFTHQIERATQIGNLVYMAPEMLSNKPYGKEIDVWGLGVLIYELLTGEPPFTSINQVAQDVIDKKILTAMVNYPSSFPVLAKQLVERMLVVIPEERMTIQEENEMKQAVKFEQFEKKMKEEEGKEEDEEDAEAEIEVQRLEQELSQAIKDNQKRSIELSQKQTINTKLGEIINDIKEKKLSIFLIYKEFWKLKSQKQKLTQRNSEQQNKISKLEQDQLRNQKFIDRYKAGQEQEESIVQLQRTIELLNEQVKQLEEEKNVALELANSSQIKEQTNENNYEQENKIERFLVEVRAFLKNQRELITECEYQDESNSEDSIKESAIEQKRKALEKQEEIEKMIIDYELEVEQEKIRLSEAFFEKISKMNEEFRERKFKLQQEINERGFQIKQINDITTLRLNHYNKMKQLYTEIIEEYNDSCNEVSELNWQRQEVIKKMQDDLKGGQQQ